MERKIVDKLAELSFLSRARLSEMARCKGITLPTFQLRVLSIVGRFPDQHQQTLLQRRGWDKGQVARAFRELEQQGLIRRCGSSTARRITEAALTEEGRELFERLERIRSELASTMMAGCTLDETRQFDALLDRVLDNIGDGSPGR
ncbi:MarR family transcriptional regulator [uncultured Kushneria sp.]|uniref:MarR family winged helix-turn-helix transcriptional regulator n=1 Tax=uncultured Kushneria sp. TaxID=905033 RepID=UPI002607324A|nr:MarR family transcriptional regulator [uncultured Kushneria sp.]